LGLAALGGIMAFLGMRPSEAAAATPAAGAPTAGAEAPGDKPPVKAEEPSATEPTPAPTAKPPVKVAAPAPKPQAAPTEPGGKPEAAPRPDPDEGVARPAAEDLRSGHFLLGIAGVVLAPSANVVVTSSQVGQPTVGGGFRAMLGIGVSQHVVLRADGGGGWLSGGDQCDGCSAASYDVGLGVDYHLAQGIAFDPWVGIGMGYRYGRTATPQPAGGDQTDHSSGIDLLRISLGGEFYPLALLGFGPFIETDVGVLVDPGTKAYGVFLAGLRVSLDPMGYASEMQPAVARR
jgi:hypothetical protein